MTRPNENDPRVRYSLKRGENPTASDRRLMWLAAGAIIVVVGTMLVLGVIEVLRPPRTNSDAAFEHSEECGGPVTETQVHFDRFFLPERVLDQLRRDVRGELFSFTVMVDVRDDEGLIGHAESRKRVTKNATTPVAAAMTIGLNRAPVGEVTCVAWAEF